MAVVIRLTRTGRRNRPCYRIHVADSRSPRDGRALENLGLYDPICPNKEEQAKVDVERARHWLEHGAKPSETVRSLFKRMGVYAEWQPPTAKQRRRPGRKKKTQTGARKQATKAARAEAKASRRTARNAARAAASKAEQASEGEE